MPPLESANWISELVVTNPDGDLDTPEEGDDHIRMIKKVLANHFGDLPNEALDTAFVKKAGDTMTGDLTVDTDVTVSGLLSADGAATVGTTLGVTGAATVGSLGVAGLATGQTPAADANNKEFATTDWVQTELAGASASTQVMVVQHTATQGQPGGNGVSGSWQTRMLNATQFSNITGATLSGNVVSLPPGTYEFNGEQFFNGTNHTQPALLIDGVRYPGMSMHVGGNDEEGAIPVHAVVTLTKQTSPVELQYRIGSSFGSGIGEPANYGLEVFAMLTIRKIA